MKNNYDPVKGTSPDDDPPNLYEGFEENGTGSHPVCALCGAMMPPRFTKWLQVHRDFHARVEVQQS